MEQPEKNSVEARIRVVRFGIMAVSTVFITMLITLTMITYYFAADASDAVGGSFELGDYLGSVAPVLVICIVIVVGAGAAINVAYTRYIESE